MLRLTSMVPEQELRSSCLISRVVDHHRDGDYYPMDCDHSRRVKGIGMRTVQGWS